MSVDQKEAVCRTRHNEMMARHQAWLDENAQSCQRHASMRAQVEAWPAPALLSELKAFMLQQLDLSAGHYSYPLPAPPPMKRDEWYASALAAAEAAVARSRQRLSEEQDRVAQTNLWLQALRASLRPTDGRAV